MSTSTATSPQLPATAAPVPSQHANQVQQIQQTPTTSWKDQIYLGKWCYALYAASILEY